jgi:hypothetical protein
LSDIPQSVHRRLQTLKGLRQPHEVTWRECYDYSYPERGVGLNGNLPFSQALQSQKNRILDDTAADAARIVAAQFVSATTPANSQWIGWDAGQDVSRENEQDDAARWLDNAAKIMFENLQQSNFNSLTFDCALDFVVAGWPVLYADEEIDGGYRFEQWPIAQCFISASRAGGSVDTIYREVELTVEQVVTEYGIDNVSHQVAEAYRLEKYDEKVCICHAIYPRPVHMVGAKQAKNLPWASCHVELATRHLLKEGGYHEFPCFIPRMSLIPGTAYSVGLMSQALGSIRTINDIKALELAAMDVAVSGMWIAEDDGVLNPRSIKIGPRKIVVANSVDSMKPLQSGANFQVAFTAEERLQATIRKIMMADTLPPTDDPSRTAYEISVRVQLIRQLLGPMTGRYESDLRKFADRLFGLAYRAGALGVPPESLRGKNFTAKFQSALARAQSMEEVMAMDRVETTIMQEMQIDPSVADNYDLDAAIRLRSKYLGAPQSVLRTPESRDKLREERAAMQQEQQQQAQAAQLQQTAGEAIINKAAA